MYACCPGLETHSCLAYMSLLAGTNETHCTLHGTHSHCSTCQSPCVSSNKLRSCAAVTQQYASLNISDSTQEPLMRLRLEPSVLASSLFCLRLANSTICSFTRPSTFFKRDSEMTGFEPKAFERNVIVSLVCSTSTMLQRRILHFAISHIMLLEA